MRQTLQTTLSLACGHARARAALVQLLCVSSLVNASVVCEASARDVEPLPDGFAKVMQNISRDVEVDMQDAASRRIVSSSLLMKAHALWKNERDPTKKRDALYELQGLLFSMMNQWCGGRFDGQKPAGMDKAIVEVLAGGVLDETQIETSKEAKRVSLAIYKLGTIDDHASSEIPSLGVSYTSLDDDSSAWHKYRNTSSLQREYVLNPLSESAFQFVYGSHVYFVTTKPFSIKRGSAGEGASCFLSDGSLLVASLVGQEQIIRLSFYGADLRKTRDGSVSTSEVYSPEFSLYPNAHDPDAWNISVIDGGMRGWFAVGTQEWIVHKSGKIDKVKSEVFDESFSAGNYTNTSLVALFEGIPYPSFRTALSGFHAFKGFKNDKIGQCTMNRHCGGSMTVGATPVHKEFNPWFSEDSQSGEESAFEWSCLNDGDSHFKPFAAQKRGQVSVPWDALGPLGCAVSWPSSNRFFIPSTVFMRPWNNYIHSLGDTRNAESVDDALFFYGDNNEFQRWMKGVYAGDAADGRSILVTRRTGRVLTVSPDYGITQVREFETPDKHTAIPVSMIDSHKAGIFLVGNEVVLGLWK